MLFPFTRVWTRRQKRLIVGSVVLALASFGAAIYGFERYYRGPSDSILVGTWEMTMPYGMDSATWVKLGPDHTAIWFSDSIAGYQEDFRSHWFAAGPYIYMRYEGKRMIWQIVEILPDELRLRCAKQDYIFKRVTREPPQASNQAMERTATRHAFVSDVATIFLLRSTLALGGGRSSCSR
jgi:hypothetical protein